MSRHFYGRLVRGGVFIVLVALLAVAGTVAAMRDTDRTAASPAGRPTPASAVPHPTPAPVRSVAEVRSEALTALLARRAQAVLQRDRARFLATVDPAGPAFYAAQRRLFDALSMVRFASWRYDIDASDAGRAVPHPSRFRGVTETYAPASVVVLYQLATYDTAPASTHAGLTFVRRGARWLLAADADFDRTAARTQREVWDYGPLTTVIGPRTMVIGPPASRRLMMRLRAEAERAIPRVSAIWGPQWSQRVAIVVPASQQQLAGILNRPSGSLSRIAAVATAELGADGANDAVGNRILVNPANVDRLGSLGRQVVLTHEITHVATRAATSAGAPTWLVEGIADYVAYRSTAIPVLQAARTLAAAVRAGRLPTALPADRAFSGTNPSLAQAYEEAWLAVRLIAQRAGQAAMLRFYRAVAGASAPRRAAAFGTALSAELGVTPAGFTALWRNYLRTSLG